MKKALPLPDFVVSFMDTFRKAGFEIYLVGGPVRNLLLQKPINNWDLTTNAQPEEIQKLFSDSVYNNDYGTVIIPLEIAGNEEKIIFEVTPFRTEGTYSDGRHPDDIIWANSINDDLVRRDFTINALAYDGENLIDITEGLKDIDKKIIRAVGDPDKRFQEDGLRLIRAVRFATQLEFVIEDKTRESIIKNAHLLQNISWERIRDEFLKILSSEHPANSRFQIIQSKSKRKHPRTLYF
jgi:tRNA nucleotidyltransferase/poly(A) polymerase